MAIIYSYPKETNPQPTDLLIGTSTVTVDGKQSNVTRSYSLQTITDYIKTLGGVGLGKIGKEVIDRALSFGLKVLGYDPYVNADLYKKVRIKIVDLDKLTRESDIITLHVPLNESTTDLFNLKR